MKKLASLLTINGLVPTYDQTHKDRVRYLMIVVEYVNFDSALWRWNSFGSLEMWALAPSTLLYRRIRALKSEKCNKTLISVQVYGFWYIFLFFLIKSATFGCPKGCVAKIATNY